MILCVYKLCDRKRFPRSHNEVLSAHHLLHYAEPASQVEPGPTLLVCVFRLRLMSVGISTHRSGNGLE